MESKDGKPAPKPAPDERPWQEDRRIFERDHEGKVFISAESRKRWSDKNPYKFHPDCALKIIQYIGMGCFLESAAAAAEINRATLYNWMKRVDSGDETKSTEDMRQWKVALDVAAANAEARAIGGIQKAGFAGIWQANAWFLERRFPDRWSQKSIIDHRSDDGSMSPPKRTLTSEEMIREAAEIVKEMAPIDGNPPGTKNA